MARMSMLASHTAIQVRKPTRRHGLLNIAKPGFEPVQLPAGGIAFNHRLDAG
jgi:hypothetical protein